MRPAKMKCVCTDPKQAEKKRKQIKIYTRKVEHFMIIISHSEIYIGKKNKLNRANGEGKLIEERDRQKEKENESKEIKH